VIDVLLYYFVYLSLHVEKYEIFMINLK